MEEVWEEGFGGGWGPSRRHRTALGWVRAEDKAQPARLSSGAPGTLPLVLAVATERTVAATYPVPHDLTHAAIRLEVTLQGHGVTSHHGWERLDVDSQVACGEKEKREVRARGGQEGRADLGGVAGGADTTLEGAVHTAVCGTADGARMQLLCLPVDVSLFSEPPGLPWVSPILKTLPGMDFPVKVGPAGT